MAGLSPPRVLLFAGLPGAGKTRLARPLAEARGWTYLNRDEIHGERYAGLAPEAWKPLANRDTEMALRAALARGESVVVDGLSFASRALRRQFAAAAQAGGAEVWVIWVDCPVDEAIRRVEASRAGHPSGAERDAARVREVAARFEVPEESLLLRLDAREPPERLLAQLQAAL